MMTVLPGVEVQAPTVEDPPARVHEFGVPAGESEASGPRRGISLRSGSAGPHTGAVSADVGSDDLPEVILCDVDGTLALRADRSPYPGPGGELRAGEDLPNTAVIRVLRDLRASTPEVVFLSGRTEAARWPTELWLRTHVLDPGELPTLHLRAVGDTRSDDLVKAELHDRHVAGRRRVRLVLDDRDRVVAMWRARGLVVLQVADGAF